MSEREPIRDVAAKGYGRGATDLMLARVSSTSYVSALPEDQRAAVLAEVTSLLERGPIAEHGATFIEWYRTELFWSQRA